MTCIITPVSFCNDALCHHTSQEVLKPHAYQANLDIWSFYTENYLSQFPPYDCELISHTDLTLADITHGYFSQSVLQGLRPISGVDVASTYAYLELMLIKYAQLKEQAQMKQMLSGAVLPSGWRANWNQLQDHYASIPSNVEPCNRLPLVSGFILGAVLLCCIVMACEEPAYVTVEHAGNH